MKRFEVDLKQVFEVTFTEPEEVFEFFLKGDWCKTFYKFNDESELVEHLTQAFAFTSTHFDKQQGKCVKFIEGFGLFIENTCSGEWACELNNGSHIRIEETAELSVDSVLNL